MKQNILAVVSLAACLSSVSISQATVQPPCIGAWAAARPGPIMPLQKAVRLIVNPIVETEADFSVRLLDASAQEIQVVREPVGDGTYFLYTAQDVPVGSYLLEYMDACEVAAQNIDLAVIPAPALPPSIGTLTMTYEAYCPGETFDSPWGPLSKDFPPPVYVAFELAPDLHAFGPFVRIQVQRDWEEASATGIFPFYWDRFSFAFKQPSACGGISPSVPLGHRIVTVTADIVDGPTLPFVSAEADITCLNCPPKTLVEPGPTPMGENSDTHARTPYVHGCSVGQTGAGGSFASVLVLVALTMFRRRGRH